MRLVKYDRDMFMAIADMFCVTRSQASRKHCWRNPSEQLKQQFSLYKVIYNDECKETIEVIFNRVMNKQIVTGLYNADHYARRRDGRLPKCGKIWKNHTTYHHAGGSKSVKVRLCPEQSGNGTMGIVKKKKKNQIVFAGGWAWGGGMECKRDDFSGTWDFQQWNDLILYYNDGYMPPCVCQDL